jgi:hypothetical protein
MPSTPTHALARRQQAAQQELGEDEGRHELHRLELGGGERTLTGGGPRVEASPGGLDETDSYEEQDRDDEDVRGGREERAGLAYATKVAGQQDDDHANPDRDHFGPQRRGCGGDRREARGDPTVEWSSGGGSS